MKSLRILMIGLVAVAAVATTQGRAQAVLLPGLEVGNSFSAAVDISDLGLAVGFAEDGDYMKAVYWNVNANPIAAEDLDPLPGNNYSAAYGVNASGLIVGESGALVGDTADGNIVAVYWDNGIPIQLPAHEDTVGAYAAYSINGTNQIVGESVNDSEGNTVAVRWSAASAGASVLSLHDSNWEYSAAYYIHDDGIIVGEAKPNGQPIQGVIWTPTGGDTYTVTLLPPADDDVASVAYGVGVPTGDLNAPSLVVGETKSPDGTVRGIVWTLNMLGTNITNVQTLALNTSAQAINDFNVIVGYTGAGTGNDRAASWNLVNLNVARNIGETFSQAYAVNNANEVVGLQNGQGMLVSATATLGRAYVGVFRNGQWYLDTNGNGVWDAGIDTLYRFGIAGDIPVVGDWNGDGRKQVGVFRNGQWYLDTNGNGVWEAGVDTLYRFGIAGDIPVTGDWNGDGRTQIGVFRNGQWYLDSNGNGVWNVGVDTLYRFGIAGDTPITGDWNGDGRTQIGVHRDRSFYLDTTGDGVWNALADTLHRFGNIGDIPVTGDWNGDGRTQIGALRDRTWYLDQDGNGVWNSNVDVIVRFGSAGDRPVTGAW